MKAKALPTQEFLNSVLDYDQSSGKLTWKIRHVDTFKPQPQRTPSHIANAWNAAFAGRDAFTSVSRNGYHTGSINGDTYYAHRLIYKMMHGADPIDVDHVDGNRLNNKLSNLASKTRGDNLKNRSLSRNNTSGFHGVSYSNRHKLWTASIYNQNSKVHLGWFREKEDAVVARNCAEIEFGYHENHGRTQNQERGPQGAR